MAKDLKTKIKEYKELNALSATERNSSVTRECRALEEELGIERILPREYVFLNSIRENLRFGKANEVDLATLAKEAGYTKNYYENPQSMILGRMPRKLIEHVIGIDERDVMLELTKMYRQDTNATAKLRALELASKILAMQGDDGDKILIQVGGGIPIAD